MKTVTAEWLKETAQELRDQGVDREEWAKIAEKKFRREFVAEKCGERDFNKEWNHLEAQVLKIRSYFLTQTNKERGQVESIFEGIYYYYGNFWTVRVPIVMGRSRINALDHLKITVELFDELHSNDADLQDYISVFADTYDYGYGIQEIEKKCPTEYAVQLFRSSDKHLGAVISLLFQARASSKAIEECRSVVEIVLKAAASVVHGYTDDDLRKKFGHNLERLVDWGLANGFNELSSLRDEILLLPDIQIRYEAEELTFGELWASYKLAIRTSLAIIRHIGGRDCRKAFGILQEKP